MYIYQFGFTPPPPTPPFLPSSNHKGKPSIKTIYRQSYILEKLTTNSNWCEFRMKFKKKTLSNVKIMFTGYEIKQRLDYRLSDTMM